MKKLVGSKAIRKKLKKELTAIRKAYTFTLKNRIDSSFDEWLCGNYYLIEKEGMEIITNLAQINSLPSDDGVLPRLFDICIHMITTQGVNSEGNIIEYLEKKQITGRETELFELMLRCALVHRAFEGCSIKGEQGAHLLEGAVKGIRKIVDIDFQTVLEKISPVEKILIQDPSGFYNEMDEQGKSLYRQSISRQAQKSKKDDEEVAIEALKRAQRGKTQRERHIGSYILNYDKNARVGATSIVLEILIPVAVSVVLGFLLRSWYVPLLLLFPIWEILRYPIETIFMKRIKPNALPALDLNLQIPDDALTLITVSTLLPNAHRAGELQKRMLELLRSNGQKNVKICILADLKSADVPVKPEDKTDIGAAVRIVKSMNQRYSNSFILAVRPRVYSNTQQNYSGWERKKRGAITQLIRIIKGRPADFTTLYGDVESLSRVKYILALDSDTYLPMDTAAEMVEIALHPLNRPVIDEKKGVVTKGYGIIVPNVNVEISSVRSTGFASIMAGEGGLTAYCSHCCERYQDLFGEGIFSGKGLIDVDAFFDVLDDSLPEERVLSHDILEGSFLRTGLASNVQVADGFPKRQNSYYDRLERWIRGDWQNIIFLFGNTPINRLSKFKLFDNLRRSITPVFAMLGLLLAVLFPLNIAVTVSAVCLVSAMAGDLFSVVRALASGGPSLFSRANYSGTIPGAVAALIRCIIWVIMLAQTAWVSFFAICRAVWRSFVSGRRLLDWTTAAQSESRKKWQHSFIRLLPTLTASMVLLVFGAPWQKLLGLIMLINIPFAFFSAKEIDKSNRPIGYKKREKLLSHASAMWQYFAEFCTKENNYLVPDNVQETPVYRIAQRTSPTNIGMMLLCFLAARDFGFIDSFELYERLNKSLNSIDKLEKWEGNLLNWYDTTNLKPLNPKYVSTVDSGNFLCSLVTLRQGLSEYTFENAELEEIRQRLTEYIEMCNLSPLYNKRRRLFHIGIDLSTGELSSSYYDLLMTEARMTGYFAIASRAVPKRHWGSLGRMLAKSGRHTGPVSWTGTMFEYFMPNIFLPAPKGTLSYEALKFCVQCQRNRVKGIRVNGKAVPWGISESGFYAFDRQLSYQYKAHGVQKLGLKRGLNSELVVSPYSTFLALSTEPDEAIKNLNLFDKLEVSGRFGLYEAIDYTHSRTAGESYAVVRSYMAHHLGMSMLSVLNALGRNIIQKRFVADSQMACAACLLHEKIQHGASVYKDVEIREIPKTRERTEPVVKEYDKLTPSNPHIKLLSNREWSCGITDVGACVSLYRGASIFRSSKDLFRRPQGVFAFVKAGKTVLPCVSAMSYSSNADFKAEFLGNEVKHYSRLDKISIKMQTRVHSHLPCEQRQFTIKNFNENDHLKCELIIYFEPSLAPTSEEEAHFAFSKLFLEDEFDKNNSIMVFKRRIRNNKQSLCLAVGFAEKVDYTFEGDRERVLECGLGLESLVNSDKQNFSFQRGNPDACAAYCIPIRIAPKESKKITLLLYAATTKEEAINGIVKMREEKGIKTSCAARGLFNGDGLDSVIANSVVPQIFYSTKDTIEYKEAVNGNNRGTPALWSLGISGDYPIIYIEIFNSEDIVRTIPYIRINKTLRSIGVFTDVVIAYRDGGEYDAPIINAIRKALKDEGCEHSLNVNGGVFAIDISKIEHENLKAVMAAAVFIAPTTGERFEKPEPAFKPVTILPLSPSLLSKNGDFFVKDSYFTDGKFCIPKNTFKPRVPWSLVLCNQIFGTLVSDKALGFTWAINSRENKMTPWFNDTRTDNRGEMLLLKINDKFYDLILGSAAVFADKCASWYGETDEMKFSVSVTVPEKGMVKLCKVKIKNNTDKTIKAKLAYYCEPVLGVNSSKSRLIEGKLIPEGIIMTSAWSDLRGFCVLCLKGGCDFVCCDRAAFLSGYWQSEKLLPLSNPCAAVGKNISIDEGGEVELDFSLSWAVNQHAAESMPTQHSFIEARNSIRISTPDKSLNHLFNTWLPTQILKSRLFGRTGFYQCGGAWGFRDQLQDVSAFALSHPDLVKRHIIRCCSVQFEQGDVLHWWHRMPERAGGLRGVRTRYSDDLLWLPYFTGEYVEKTGDAEILKVKAPFIQGDELRENEHERYFHPSVSNVRGTVYEHCIRAVDKSLSFGEHGLPLIGGGDWNDGFNKVGIKGKGESVWLAQFMLMVLEKTIMLCRIMNDEHRAKEYSEIRAKLTQTIDKYAWSNDRYIRAFYDDSTPMGGVSENGTEECAVDSLTQAFATLSDMPDIQRRKTSLETAVRELVDKENRIIKLLKKPFSGKGMDAGYITAYPKGIRENGGQYTHAAIWLCMALLRSGDATRGYELLKMINPAEIMADSSRFERYRAEPYALAGDVSSAKSIEGRAGWSLYTGSAAWYYRAVLEEILGIRQKDMKLFIEPNLPKQWDKVRVQICHKNAEISIEIANKLQEGKLTVDGKDSNHIPLDGKNHYAVFE